MTSITLIWKCNKPRSAAAVQLCETLMIQAARTYGMDTAIIRKEAHSTTRIGGRYVRTVPHITGDIVHSQSQTGYALHWNLTANASQALPSQPNAPNPEMWALEHKNGQGFILVGDPY